MALAKTMLIKLLQKLLRKIKKGSRFFRAPFRVPPFKFFSLSQGHRIVPIKCRANIFPEKAVPSSVPHFSKIC